MRNNPKFTWDPVHEDPEIRDHGKIAAYAYGKSDALQAFVEALSIKINAKCDWEYAGGTAHIDALPGNLAAARAAIRDEAWIGQFLIPYSDESIADGTYFQIGVIPRSPEENTERPPIEDPPAD